jgi:hypothetical protein
MGKYNETSELIKVVEGQELREGEWVGYSYNREMYLGYTTINQGYNWIEVEVIKPVRQSICVPKNFLCIAPFHNYSWDTPYVLELAREMNDTEWENEIVEEISMWHSVDDMNQDS